MFLGVVSMHRFIPLALCAVFTFAAAPASAALTAESGALHAYAQAKLSQTSTQVDDDAWIATPATLAAEAHASAMGSNFVDSVLSASWSASGLSGSVEMSHSVSAQIVTPDQGISYATYDGAPAWTYVFTLDDTADLTIDWVAEASGQALTDYVFTLNGAETALGGGNGAGASGGFAFALGAGQHTLSLFNRTNATFPDARAGFSHIGQQSLAFDFTITPADTGGGGPVGGVPEPATWALMIGGLGLAGATLRRRRILAAG